MYFLLSVADEEWISRHEPFTIKQISFETSPWVWVDLNSLFVDRNSYTQMTLQQQLTAAKTLEFIHLQLHWIIC